MGICTFGYIGKHYGVVLVLGSLFSMPTVGISKHSSDTHTLHSLYICQQKLFIAMLCALF